jgi:hypothetical protein
LAIAQGGIAYALRDAGHGSLPADLSPPWTVTPANSAGGRSARFIRGFSPGEVALGLDTSRQVRGGSLDPAFAGVTGVYDGNFSLDRREGLRFPVKGQARGRHNVPASTVLRFGGARS